MNDLRTFPNEEWLTVSFVMSSTAGVTIGDPVLRTGKPLSVELGPGNSTVNQCTLTMGTSPHCNVKEVLL